MSSSDQQAVNRRRHKRVPLKLSIRLSTIDAEVDPASGRTCFRTSEEVCANVSRGGAFVPTRDPMAPGRRVIVEIDLPGGNVVEAVGRVAWTRILVGRDAASSETGLGIEFIGGDPDQLALLERHLVASERASSEHGRGRAPGIRARSVNPSRGA